MAGKGAAYDIVFDQFRERFLRSDTTMPMRRIFLLLPFLLSACGAMPKFEVPKFDVSDYFSVYRADINQGNYITQEMVSQLKPGLTRDQVRYILGSPLVTDVFHASRWDYVYRFSPGHGDAQQRRLSVYFEDDKLNKVSGDVVPDDGTTKKTALTPTPASGVAPEVVAPPVSN